MTLKYESELLYELMKRDGDDTPSDVLPYESELKEKYVNQVVGAYPKLQDYRPEWLNYNLYHHLPSDFPVEVVSNVTNATFQNVVPYNYKSAILKGQTLVNLYPQSEFDALYTSRVQVERGYRYTQTQHNGATRIEITSLKNGRFKTNTTYYVQLTTKVNKARLCEVRFEGGQTSTITLSANETKVIKAKVGSWQTLQRFFIYFRPSDGSDYLGDTFDVLDLMVIEHQEGMENWDIPYFEGMQSVKLPVLTTSNGDGTKTNILSTSDEIALRSNGNICDELDLLTGQLTQKLKSYTTGINTPFTFGGSNVDLNQTLIAINLDDSLKNSPMLLVSDKLPYKTPNYAIANGLGVELRSDGRVFMVIPAASYSDIKTWLTDNPITFLYPTEVQSIKTVELTCIDEQGENVNFMPIEGTMHVKTSSNGLQPLLDMSVPVEAITQNLNSFANMKEE